MVGWGPCDQNADGQGGPFLVESGWFLVESLGGSRQGVC